MNTTIRNDSNYKWDELVDGSGVQKISTNANTSAHWFEDAGFGIFLHWNLTSISEVEDYTFAYPIEVEDEKQVPESYLRPEEWGRLAEQFDPDQYDPDEWLAMAKEAGMEYAVLTTKHHLGYCLWPTEYGEFSVKHPLLALAVQMRYSSL